MKIRLQVLSACVLVAAVPAAWSNGGGPDAGDPRSRVSKLRRRRRKPSTTRVFTM